jgi:hypothetical protein
LKLRLLSIQKVNDLLRMLFIFICRNWYENGRKRMKTHENGKKRKKTDESRRKRLKIDENIRKRTKMSENV